MRKCEGNEVTISENKNFKEYWTLLSDVLKKFDTKPVHTEEEIKLLNKKFPENIRLFEARKDNFSFSRDCYFLILEMSFTHNIWQHHKKEEK